MLLLVGLGTITALLAVTPLVINSLIVGHLDLGAARQGLTKVVQSQTGLTLTVQGVKYRFLRGIVFHGVQLHPVGAPPGSFVLQAESIILELSLWQALRGEDPFDRVVITEGRVNPYALSAQEWAAVLEHFQKAQSTRPAKGAIDNRPAEERLLERVTFLAEGLRLLVPETVIPGGRRRLVDQLRIGFRMRPGDRIWNMELSTGDAESDARLVARGRWDRPEPRRINFRFAGIPLPLLYRLTARLPMWPPELRIPIDRMDLTEGVLNGKGSLDVVGAGIGVNFEGEYRGVTLRIGPRSGVHLGADRSDGQFRYNTAFLAFLDGPAQAQLELTQPDLTLNFLFRNIQTKKQREHFVHAKVRATVADAAENQAGVRIGIPGGLTSGKIDVDLRYDYKRGWLEPDLTAKLDGLRIRLVGDLFRLREQAAGPERIPVLVFDKAEFKQKPGSQLTLEATGNLDGAAFRLEGAADSSFRVDADPKDPGIALRQDIKATVSLDGLSYRLLFVPAIRVHSQLIAEGSRADADKAEEHGLLRKYRFVDQKVAAAFLDYTKLDLRFQFKNMKDAGTVWPPALEVLVYKKDAYIWLQVPEVSGPSSKLSAELTTVFQRPMPYHKATASLQVKGNTLRFPEFLGNDSVPVDVEASFDSNGHGWYPYDIIDRTYSRFSLTTRGVNVSAFTPAVILGHKVGSLKGEHFLADELHVSRRTDSNRFIYSEIRLRSPQLSIRGTGDYVTLQGGEFTFDYEFQRGPEAKGEPLKGDLKLDLTAEKKWIPKSQL